MVLKKNQMTCVLHNDYCIWQVLSDYPGFIQKHENEIPGLFQDNSRTFSVFKDSISLIFDCFLPETVFRKICRTSFLSLEYFHYGIDKYRDYR